MIKKIFIVRHGARVDTHNPLWAATAKFPHDPGLSDLGHEQAERLATHLQHEGITHIYSSPYLRARQTAQPLADLIGLPLNIEDGLGEWLNPEWSKSRPALSLCFMPEKSLVTAVYPETDEQAWRRSGKAAKLISARAEGAVLMVAHGHTVCGAIFGLLGKRDVDIACEICSLTEIHVNSRGATMVRNGDRSFLRDKPSLI